MTALLQLRGVSKQFAQARDGADRLAAALGLGAAAASVQAVEAVDLSVHAREVVGLAGESGCGKSTLGRIAAGLLAPTAGTRVWRGQDAAELDTPARRHLRLQAQMVFQDSQAALNPRLVAYEIVAEAPRVHRLVAAQDEHAYVQDLFARVGLEPGLGRRYPHQLSGGQRARVGIARALAVRPELLVCDEAVAALDVSVQAQVLNLFLELRARYSLAYLFISHDLNLLRHLCDRVLIMYLGRVVEAAATEDCFLHAQHPYTRALLADAPRLEARKRSFAALAGELPSPLAPPSGCHFHPRCAHASARCRIEPPVLREISPQHFSACHLNDGA